MSSELHRAKSDKLFLGAVAGTVIVLEADRTYKEVARNKMEKFWSTPVFLGSRIYLRGKKTLYCIGG